MIGYLNFISDLNLSCTRDFWSDLVNKLKKSVGTSSFSGQHSKTISHYKKILVITLIYCNRLPSWWSTQSWLTTLLSSLIARRRVGPQTLYGSDLKTYL